jgi:probable O-glycosylation ligase (exosortase A-associated)
MKQTLLMIVLTLMGTVGVLIEPFWGVAVYYLFAVLRPQYLWRWALPADVSWSFYVAVATMIAAVWKLLAGPGPEPAPRHFSALHVFLACFAGWVALSALTAANQQVTQPWLIEYAKIFAMFFCAAVIIGNLQQIWVLYLVATLAVGYIAYEVNSLYLFQRYLGIFHNGYGGLDNNGAGLLLAMGLPLCIFAAEASRGPWRWALLAMVPVLVHAVLLTYSRGAMVSLLVVCPLIFLRSRYKRAMCLGALCLALAMPTLAGREIRAEFFSVQKYDADSSAQSRFGSWSAAWNIAKDHPALGVGPRNSPLIAYRYGADIEGRVIHNQYLQLAADSGFPALLFYLAVLGATSRSLRRTRRESRRGTELYDRRAHAMACGVETSLAVFAFGGLFLSLEVFELPFLLILIGAHLGLVVRGRQSEAAPAVAVETGAAPPWPQVIGAAPPMRPFGSDVRI